MENSEKKLWTPQEVEEEIKRIDEKIEKAEDMKNTDITSVDELMIQKGKFLKDKAKDEDGAEKVFREALDKVGDPNRKLEIYFEILKMYLFREDLDMKIIRESVEECSKLVEKGGDWEKKNKLKVYEGIYNMLIRNYKHSAALFLDSVATFTCEDFIDYKQFVFYTVVTSIVAVD